MRLVPLWLTKRIFLDFKTFAVFWILYALFWVTPRLMNCICQCFFIPIRLWRWKSHSVPKRCHIKFGRRGITQKKVHKMDFVSSRPIRYRPGWTARREPYLDIVQRYFLFLWSRLWNLRFPSFELNFRLWFSLQNLWLLEIILLPIARLLITNSTEFWKV